MVKWKNGWRNLRITVPDYFRNNLSIDRAFNMPVHKRGSMNLEYVMSLGADVRDERYSNS